MSRTVKCLIGLAAVLLMGWVWHGSMGRGEAFVGGMEAEARRSVDAIGIPGIVVRFGHDPLTRTATLSGPADTIQREGLGSEMGLSDYVRAVPGVAGVRWADEKTGQRIVPLLAETWLLLALGYGLGLLVGALIFNRRRRETFLD